MDYSIFYLHRRIDVKIQGIPDYDFFYFSRRYICTVRENEIRFAASFQLATKTSFFALT